MPNLLSSADEVNLESSGHKFAFTAFNVDGTGLAVNDPKYIRWMVMVNDYSSRDSISTPISFHSCSKDEIRELAPPALEAEDFIDYELAS